MKTSHKYLSSMIFLCMGAQSVHGAGVVTIGGSNNNITPSPTFSPLNYALDASVLAFDVVNALAANPTVTISTTGNVAGGAINVTDAVDWFSTNTLTLNSNKGINVGARLSNLSGGFLNLIANDGGVALNGAVEFTGSINVQATAGITQNNAHILRVDGLAVFNAGSSDITLAGPTNNFGSLSLTGNTVTIKEASSSILAAVDVGSLDLISNGSITQTGAVDVDGLAKFNAGANAITLTNAANKFGSLNLNGTAVTIVEQDATDLATVNATSLNVTSGGAITNSGNVVVSGAAQFSGASVNLGGGAGTASVGSLHFNSTGLASFNLLSGTSITGANTAGSFVWNTNGTASLALGSSITAGSAEIQKGTIMLSGNNQLVVTDLTVQSGATFNLGTFNNTVTTYNQNGAAILAGTGTLTATTYNLNGGNVNANLGTGTINQIGTTTTFLNGTSAASAVNVNGGTLALGSSNRLSDGAAVAINGGRFNLVGFSDTVGTFALNTGILDGTGTLTATTYDLNGGTVNANLGTGTLNQIGNTTLLNGTSSAGTVNINGGVLEFGSSDRLSNGAAVSVNNGILNLVTFNDTVGTFALNGGQLNGTGTLTAGTYLLNGGTVNANLGSGVLTQNSNTTLLNGTSASIDINVNGGSLTLGAAERLNNAAALKIAGGSLNLANFDETVGTFSINTGTLDGTGTLTASTYSLKGGAINANLGAGVLTQSINTTILNGSSGAATVGITGGTLTLGASDRLSDSAVVTLSGVGILNLGTFNDTVSTFTLNDGTLNGTGTLTATTYSLNGGTLNGNLGTGTLNQLSNLTILNGTSSAGTVNVTGGTLTLGASDRLSDSAAVTVNSAILNIGTFSDTVGTFTLNAATLNGSGTLTATTYALNGGTVNANLGTGTLNQLTSTTTLNGTSAASAVNVNGGALVMGASDRFSDSAAVTVNNAILALGAFSDTVGTFALNGGSLNGTGTLTASTYTLSGGTVNANLGTGTLTQLANATLLNGTSSASLVNVNGGTLTLGSSNRLFDSAAVMVNTGTLDLVTFSDTVGTFFLNGGSLNGTGTLTASTYTLNGGTVNANLGTGTLSQIGNATLLNGTSAASTVNVNGGALTLGASDRLANNAAVTVSSAILDLGTFSDTVGTFTLNAGILNGTGTLTAATYDLNGGTVNANLGNGILTQLTGTTVLNGTSTATTVNVNGGKLSLGASNRLSDSATVAVNNAILNLGAFNETVSAFTLSLGTLDGTGTLTAATYQLNGGTVNANLGNGILTHLSNTTILNGTSSAATVNINGGTLSLGAANRLSDSAAVTVNSAILDIGTFSDTVDTFTLNSGFLNGTGTLTASTYDLNGGTVNANLGNGILTQIGNATLLNGTSSAATVNVNGGTLTLGASNRLANNAAVTIASAGTLNIGTFSDTVGTFTLNSGILDGTGTLTAATYDLNGGTVNANLGTGILTQLTNTTQLNGTSSAATVNVNGGTLTLGASNRLANNAAVTIASAGILNLGTFSDTVGTFTLNSGILNGTGTLTAATYDLNGGTVNANLGTGILTQLSNTTQLNGTSSAATVNVNGGTLTLGASDRLANNAAVTVNASILDLGTFSDTVGSFTLNSGILNGTGTLTASSYSLNGGTVNANLGTGILNQLTNTTTLNGTSAASLVNVNGGTLTLGASDRLSDSAAVTVNSATLNIAAFSDTVGTFALNSGTLNGTGTLTAASYDLNGGTVNANLGTGILTQIGNSTLLNGTSDAGTVNIIGGTLTLGASNRLSDSAAVTVSNGTLDIGNFNDEVGSFTLISGLLTGTGSLTATTYNLSGSTINTDLGTGTLNQIANNTLLNGTSAAGVVNVNGGTLTLGASERLLDSAALTVNSATFDMVSFSETVGTFVLNGGLLDGSGTLTASTYDLKGGTVNANLGAGTLNQLSGTTLLNGTSSASAINVNGGTLGLGASDRLADNADVTVNSGTLNLGIFSDRIGTFALNGGTLNGTGLLTASLYSLYGGTVNANLDAGDLKQFSGTTTLNGTSGSLDVSIIGGTLALGRSDRLANNATVTVESAAALDMRTSNNVVENFNLNGGSLNGSGILTATIYNLNGGTINANFGTGILNQLSNTTILNGTSAATEVNIDGGTLALGASARLSAKAAVSLNSGTLDLGSFSDTVGDFTLNGGTLDGSGTLTAASYSLYGGDVNTNLGTGVLTQLSGTTTLDGTSAAGTFNVNGGTLELGGSNLLADKARVRIAGGTLGIGAFNDTVGTFSLNGGILNGSGTLTATTYNLFGGMVNANLGNGILNQTAGLTRLNGTSSASLVNILGGSLVMGASNRLSDTSTLRVQAASFDIGAFNDKLGIFALNDGILAGTGTLTASTYNLNGGIISANLGEGLLKQLDNTTFLFGSSEAGRVKITSGTLKLGAADRLDDNSKVRVVSQGILDTGGFDDLVGTYIQRGSGKLVGDGLLTVAKVAKIRGGKISGNLSGTMNTKGTVKITGTVGGGDLRVNRGNLTLTGTAESNTWVKTKATLYGTGTIDGNLKNAGMLGVDAAGKNLTITGKLQTKGVITLDLKNKNTFESVKAGSVKFGGKLIVVNTGAGLDEGESVKLFKAGSFAKSFKSVVAVGFKNPVFFDETTGKLTGLDAGSTRPNGKFGAPPASAPDSASATIGDSADSAQRAVLRVAAMPVADQGIVSSSATEAQPLKALEAMPVAALAPPPAKNRTSPEVYRGLADYTEQSLRAHVREATEHAPESRAAGTQAFATTSYNSSGVDGSSTNAGYDIDSVSVTVGARHNINGRAQIGGLLGYDDGSIDGNLIDADGSGFVFGTFGSYVLDERTNTRIVASAVYGVYDYDATRQSVGGDVRANGIGSDAIELTLGMSTVAYQKDGFRVIPGAMFRYMDGSVDGFTESGAGAGLTVGSQDISSPLLDLGVDFEYAVQPKLTFVGHLGYTFDLDGSDESVTARSNAAGSLPFSVNAPGIDNEAVILGAGIYYDISDSFRVGLTYRGEFRTSDSDPTQSVGIGASLAF